MILTIRGFNGKFDDDSAKINDLACNLLNDGYDVRINGIQVRLVRDYCAEVLVWDEGDNENQLVM